MKKIDSIILSGISPSDEGAKALLKVVGKVQSLGKAGGVGTFSGVNADSHDEQGNLIPQVYKEN